MLSLKGQKRNLRKMSLFLLLVVFLAACGGDDEGESSGSSATGNSAAPDACALLSATDVETVLGGSVVTSGSEAEGGLFSNCTWISETSGARLALNIWAAGNEGDEWATQYVAAQSGAGANETIENLGDEAYKRIDGDSGNYYWRKGNAFVLVFTATATEASEDAQLELARKIDNGF